MGRPKISRHLALLLFTTDRALAAEAAGAGVDGLIVDLERRGKERRQRGADTEVNSDTVEDLARLASVPARLHVCRLNAWGRRGPGEIEAAIEHGAGHLLLPMVRAPREVEAALRIIRGRCPLGILVETPEACGCASDLARMPLALVYVGLNDLAIARGSPSIFDAVADGTVARLREQFASAPFGFGGMTVVDGGRPIPSRLLLSEMARIECAFTFLRRSFKSDMHGRDMPAEISRLRAAWSAMLDRSPSEVETDRAALMAAIKAHRVSLARPGPGG